VSVSVTYVGQHVTELLFVVVDGIVTERNVSLLFSADWGYGILRFVLTVSH
jgi:hypothetical protein